MSGRKVCVVAPVHDWDDVRVFQKESCSLARAGYDVTLIAKAPSRQTNNGVDIVPSKGSSNFRLIRFLLLPVVGIQALLQNAEIYHLHNPDTLPLAVLLRLFGKKVIYDTHEDFTKKILVRYWIPKWLRSSLAYLVGKAETFVAKIVTASIATELAVVERLGSKTILLGNPPRISEELYARVSELARNIEGQPCELRAIYIGRIDKARGLDDMVDAMAIANETSNVRLWLIGTANESELAGARRRPGWKFVDYLPRVEQDLAFAYVERADVGLVVIHRVGGHETSDPNKLYEYMMFGKPFIASTFADWQSRLSDIDAGWFVDPESAAAIADILLRITDDGDTARAKGTNGREYIQRYNWETESQKLLALYSAL